MNLKKYLCLSMLLIGLALPGFAASWTPLQLGIAGDALQLFPPSTRVYGLRLNLLYSRNISVTGFDLGIYGWANSADAVQVNLANVVQDQMNGIEAGLYNSAGSFAGFQAGLFNYVKHDATGIQVGLFNFSDSISGFQIGLLNRTISMQGLQIGLINIIEEGPIAFFPIINGAF
jgi:hypothetical protein